MEEEDNDFNSEMYYIEEENEDEEKNAQKDKDKDKLLGYEILEQDKVLKSRESLIQQFIECSCLNYDEAELVLNHFNWNYDKLVDLWYDNTEEIKMDSHIEQSPESIVNITEYYQNNQLYENMCVICGDIKEPENYLFLKCEHKACKDCMTSYLFDKLFSEPQNVLSTFCPLKGCNLYITRTMFKKCIHDEEMLKIYDENVENIYLSKNKNIKKCINKNCKYLIKSDSNIAQEIKCKCGSSFCFHCLEEYHSPCFCDMVKQWKLLEKEIQMSTDCPKLKKEITCKNCYNTLKKEKVTNHVKCKCGAEFCLFCESNWNKHKNNCYDGISGKNKFYKYYKIVINIEHDFSFIQTLKVKINDYISELEKKAIISESECLKEAMDLVEEFYRFYKYLSIFQYFLLYDADDKFLEYNFSTLYSNVSQMLEYLEFDDIPNIFKSNTPERRYKFIELRQKILYLIKSIKVYQNNIIEEIAQNVFGRIDFKLLEEPVTSVTWSNVITSEKPVQFIIDIVNSNDFSFNNNKSKFSYIRCNSSYMSKDDEFIMKLYSYGFAFVQTKYLRTGEIDNFNYYGNLTEKDIKSSVCCLQHAIFRNNNVKNGKEVYRAIKTFRFPTYIKEKSKFYFREFLSTSTNRQFSTNWLGGVGTFLIITITNNGTNGHKNYCYYIEDISCCKGQYEVIFACHCSFILEKIERTKNIDFVYLTCEGYLFD